MNGNQQRDGDAQTQDPAAGAEQGHVHVVEHEHLIAQHGEAIEIVGPFVMLDRGDARLQLGDVRFQGMATRSRKRRWVRSLITRSTQVSMADAASPPAATKTSVVIPPSKPSAKNFSHSGISTSGSAASKDNAKEMTMSAGSAA